MILFGAPAKEAYERAATGLFLPRGMARRLGRHTYDECGAINDPDHVWWLTRKLQHDGYAEDFGTDTRDLQALARRLNARNASGYVECVAWQRASSAMFATFTTAKRVILDTAQWAVPINYLVPGRKMRVRIFGALSNIVTTPGLFNIQQRLGTIAAPIAAFDTGNIQLNATAHTTLPFFADIVLCAQVEGITTAAKLMGVGDVSGIMVTRTAGQVDDAQGVQEIIAPAGIPAQGIGYDSTIVNITDLAVGFTISSAGNGVQIHTYSLEILN